IYPQRFSVQIFLARRLPDSGYVVGRNYRSASKTDLPLCCIKQIAAKRVVRETVRGNEIDQRRCDVQMRSSERRQRPLFLREERLAVKHQRHRFRFVKRRHRFDAAARVVIAGHGEARTGKSTRGFGHEIRDTFVRIPKMAEDSQRALGQAAAQRVGLQWRSVPPFGFEVNTEWRMVGRGHYEIERGLIRGVIENELKQHLVVYAPFIAREPRAHFVATVNFLEAVLTAKISQALPAQVTAIKKSWLVAESLENSSNVSR